MQHKQRSIKYLLGMVLFIGIMTLGFSVSNDNTFQLETKEISTTPQASLVVTPFHIQDAADITALGLPAENLQDLGGGNYLFRNLIVDANYSATYGIFIDNYAGILQFDNVTIKHVLDFPIGDDGILALNVTNAGFLIVNSPNVQIRNSKVESSYFGILAKDSSGILIQDNEITNVTAVGIQALSCDSLNVISNNIHDNPFKAIIVNTSSGVLFQSNNLYNNALSGIELNEGDGCQITQNNVYQNDGIGIYVYKGDNNQIINNNVTENTNGIIIDGGDEYVNVSSNIASYNTINGISVINAINVDIEDNTANGNGVNGIVASGNILVAKTTLTYNSTVTTSGSTVYFQLQKPFASYTIQGPSLVKYINQSGYAGYELSISIGTSTAPTVNPDECYFSTTNENLYFNAANIVTDSGPYNSLTDSFYVEYAFLPDTHISGNTADDNGGSGISVGNNNYTVVESNYLHDNSYAGISVGEGGSNTIQSNTLQGNKVMGIEIVEETDTTVQLNTIYTNYDGIYARNNTNLVIVNNDLQNQTNNGITIYYGNVEVNGGQILRSENNGIEINGDGNLVNNVDIKFSTKDGIDVLGDSNTIQGTCDISNNEENGISIVGDGNTISGNQINTNGKNGVYILGNDNVIDSNTAIDYNEKAAVYFESGSSNNITNNVMVSSGIFLAPDTIDNLLSHTISGNTLNGQGITILKSTTVTIGAPTGQIIAINCTDLTITNINMNSAATAIAIYHSSNPTITGVSISSQTMSAIYLYNISTGSIINTDIDTSYQGITMELTNSIDLDNVNITSSEDFALQINGDGNTYSGNIDNNNLGSIGISILGENNFVNNSQISDASSTGIYIEGASNIISSTLIINSAEYGVLIEQTTNNTLNKLTITGDSITSIYINDSSRISIVDLSLHNSVNWGIIINNSRSITLTDSELSGNGLLLDGNNLLDFNSHTIDNTNLNGLPLAYHKDKSDVTLSATVGQLILANTNSSTIGSLDIQNTGIPIQLYYSYQNTFVPQDYSKSSLSNSLIAAAYLFHSDYNEFYNYSVSDCQYGFIMEQSNDNSIEYSSFENINEIAIYFLDVDGGLVDHTTFTSNNIGIQLDNTSNVYIQSNIFRTQTSYSINLNGGSLNYMVDNLLNATAGIIMTNTDLDFLRNSTIENPTSTAIRLEYTTNVSIETSVIKINSNLIGIYVDSTCVDTDLIRNSIDYSSLMSTIGVEILGDSTNVLLGSVSNVTTGVLIDNVDSVSISQITIEFCSSGITVSNSKDISIENSIISNCTDSGIYVGPDSENVLIDENQINLCLYGIYVLNSTNVQVSYNYFCENTHNIRALGTTNFVDFLNSNCFTGEKEEDNNLIDQEDENNTSEPPTLSEQIPGYGILWLLMSAIFTIIFRSIRSKKNTKNNN